ncbi:ATP-binding cassette sub-family A member 2 isoform X2 [Drosophila montana]
MSTSTVSGQSQTKQGSCMKLRILIRKNISVILAHPLGTAIAILAPILLFLYTQFDQIFHSKSATQVHAVRHPAIDIYVPNVTSIFYSPINNVLGRVVEDVATNLGTKDVQGFLDASELEAALKRQNGFVGIEFEDHFSTIMEIPSKVKIALRFPWHLRSKIGRKWPKRVYRPLVERMSKSLYDLEGFLIMQAKLSEALIKERNGSAHVPQVHMQPFPDREQKNFEYLLDSYSTLVMTFTFIFMGPSLLVGHQIVSEKQRHLREIMRLMGLTVGLNWLSWFIVACLFISIPMMIFLALMNWCLCPGSNFMVLLIIFIIYLLTLVCFTFVITAFVTSTVLTMSSICVLHCVSFMPYLMLGSQPREGQAIFVCLFMNSAMPLIFVQILGYEIRGLGVQWTNLFTTSHPDDIMSIGYILMMMLGTNILRIILCLYVDQLNPGEYGVAKKWYFPLKRKFWCPWERPGREFVDEERSISQIKRRDDDTFEEIFHNKPVIMETQNLCKSYGDIEAVRDLNLKFYEDEITVLLGHNGAGKTTAFMMLAGITLPTSGRVLVNGNNMATATRKARKSLSLCPQYNVLFDELSAYWHIVFYSRLKGFERSEAEAEAERYLEMMDLMDKSTIKVEYLSTGMRRKLSVCCALCANTKVVLCDEPTACLDPSARREVWNLLRMEKTGRCIVMNTHFMEAAEVLGDRIAIMCDGELYGYGTAEFLVNNLGPGYRLVCVVLEDCDDHEVTKFLRNHINDAELESVTDTELTYRLPVESVHKFTSLFKAMESRLEKLKISSFGVSAPTLGETFMKIGNEKIGSARTLDSMELTNAWVSQPSDNQELSATKKRLNVWHGMMIKKVLFTWSHPLLFSFVVFLPLFGLLMLAVFDIVYTRDIPHVVDPSKLSLYPAPLVVHEWLVTGIQDGSEIFYDKSKLIADEYEIIAMDAGATAHALTHLSVGSYLLNNIDLNKEGFKETYVAATTYRDGSVTAWFNRRLEHGAPLSLGLIFNAIAHVLGKMDIVITNKPRPDSDSKIFKVDRELTSSRRAVFILMYLSFALSTFILLPVYEKATQMREQQFINGIGFWTYWLSHLAWDFIFFILIIISTLLSLYKLPGQVLYMLAILLFFFGLSSLTFTYLFTYFFNEAGSGMSYMLIINCCIVFLAIFTNPHENKESYKYFHYIFMVLPLYLMYFATLTVLRRGKPGNCEILEMGYVCNINQNCCEEKKVVIYPYIITLIVTAILFFLLLLLASKIRPLRYAIKRDPTACATRDVADDVKNASKEVDEVLKDQNKLNAHSLVCSRATKKYRRLVAVNCVSLKISPYECFGLLGLNGAGKTSTIDMIVGNHMISQGEIYVKGFSVKNQLKQCYQHTGFCSQNNTMLSYMTGRQMLRFTCLTSGMKKNFIKVIIGHLATSFVLSKHLDQKTKHYSSGTKRKLNIAMALLARTLVCLDEPTTGVDIIAKQEIWLVLSDMRELGRSLFLTSHNMQECEALCSCLAILVNGTLRCYGSVQQLKNLYNKGVSIKIQLATNAELAQRSFISNWTDSGSARSRRSSVSKEIDSEINRIPVPAEESEPPLRSPSMWVSISEEDPNTKGTQATLKKRRKRQTKIITPSKEAKSPSLSPAESARRTTIIPRVTITSVSPKSSMSSRRTESWRLGSENYSYSDAEEYYGLFKNLVAKFKEDFPNSYVS